jgi:hypothetical protein
MLQELRPSRRQHAIVVTLRLVEGLTVPHNTASQATIQTHLL